MKILYVLQQRWKSKNKERRSIRFETDPEWQPDDRVVLFQQFFHGNRTWVLCDFDRYILTQWRPQGATIIFGDRFVQKKQREGMKLCSYCGMIEQQVGSRAHARVRLFEFFQEQNLDRPIPLPRRLSILLSRVPPRLHRSASDNGCSINHDFLNISIVK